MMDQFTLRQEVRAVGTGLHSGNLIQISIKPAPPNSGIVFSRTDLGGATIKAEIANVDFTALQMATTLKRGELVVQTTEHLLSALYGMGVDNAWIELDGPEVPIMDGSAAPFLVLIEESGLKRQAVPKKVMQVTQPFSFEIDGKRLAVEPAQDLRITYEIDFEHPMIRRQLKTVVVDTALYESQIAPARTFGFLKDVNFLKSRGLIRGASLENAIVLGGDRILNEGLRLSDEFVSHKILDMIGDLALGGYRLQGHFTAFKAGHEVHARFLQALLEKPEYYRIRASRSTATARSLKTQPVGKSLLGAVS